MDVSRVAQDLQAEQQALDDVVSAMSDGGWAMPTPSPGWTVADQIGHLTYFDRAAATAITDPVAFRTLVSDLFAAGSAEAVDEVTLGPCRRLPPSELTSAWRRGRVSLAEAAATLSGDDRIAWYGPSMGSKSFLTARLMEAWAHGQDVVDAVVAHRTPTDRLRHIAQLGSITRGWSYANRGLDIPDADVRVTLDAPSGGAWSFGPDDATDSVAGPAEDFCLVVTQRRHVDDTALQATPVARDWLLKAQCFAGPPTDGPAPGTRP